MKILEKSEMKNIKGGRVSCRRTGNGEDNYREYRCCESSRPDWACWTDWYYEPWR
jgi:hypothetical protein